VDEEDHGDKADEELCVGGLEEVDEEDEGQCCEEDGGTVEGDGDGLLAEGI
jgi:hypothetical protein